MYSLLGAFAAATGKIFGVWLQNPLVLAGVGLFLLIPALSMFELFHLHIPGLPQNLPASGFLRYFISGVLAGLIAAPCVGPPVVALLAQAAVQNNPVNAFLIFFILSLGLGLPYIFLGTFSGNLRHLPKSGAWLVWIKKTFGFVLLGWAFFYFVLAFKPAFLKWVIPTSMVVAAIYLGFLERGNHKLPFKIFQKVFGIILLAAAAFLIFKPMPATSVVWELYHSGSVSATQPQGKPVIMDFYADWCIPCHELDETTYRDFRVVKALEGFRRVKVNLTNEDNAEGGAAVEQFEVQGVPTILFLDRKGNEIKPMRTTGYIDADEFLLLLKAYQKELS